MRFIKKVSCITVILIFIAFISGCSRNGIINGEEQIHIEVIVKNKIAPYWTVVEMGAIAAGKEFGVNIHFDGPTDEKDIEEQINMVQKAIDSKADAIVLAACDSEKLVDVAHEALSKKIPVITIDSGINSQQVNSFIGTDNVGAGEKLGQALVNKVGDSCKIVVMSFVKGAASCDQREEGLFKTLDMYEDIQIVDIIYCNSDVDTAENLTVEIIEKYSDIDAIVGLNAYGTTGAAKAIIEQNKVGTIKIIGFDSTPEEVRYLERDIIQSLVVQNPFSMGYLGVKYAFDAIKNEKIPNIVDTGSTVIDKDSMFYIENQKLVFPFTDGLSDPTVIP